MQKNNFFDKYIGKKFIDVDDKGNYMGCLLPFYLLYPNAYRFKPFEFTDESTTNLLLQHCKQVNSDYKFGDLFIFKSYGLFHAAVYVDNSKFVHCGHKQTIKYIHKSLLRYKALVGVYRWA